MLCQFTLKEFLEEILGGMLRKQSPGESLEEISEEYLEKIPGEIAGANSQRNLWMDKFSEKSPKKFLAKILGEISFLISGRNPQRHSWAKSPEKFLEKTPGRVLAGNSRRKFLEKQNSRWISGENLQRNSLGNFLYKFSEIISGLNPRRNSWRTSPEKFLVYILKEIPPNNLRKKNLWKILKRIPGENLRWCFWRKPSKEFLNEIPSGIVESNSRMKCY